VVIDVLWTASQTTIDTAVLKALSGMKRIWKETREPDLQRLIQVAEIRKRIN
jgi:hypothetical protein